MKFKRKPEPPKSNPRWLVTFNDLTMLILVFFILLFSMSQIDMMKFRALAESFANRNIFDFYPSIVPGSTGPGHNMSNGDGEMEDLQELVEDIRGYLKKNGLEDVIVANRTERGVVIVLQEQVLFETGRAEIINGTNDFLDKVGTALQGIPNIVKVEGHTDDRPINTYRYPSNWELSSARSSSVIRYLSEKHELNSNRFIAVGYGDTRPVAPNTSSENWTKNRRVEIVILDPSYKDGELLDS